MPVNALFSACSYLCSSSILLPMPNADPGSSQARQPGNSQAEEVDAAVTRQVAENDTYETNESATGQLASMLDTDFNPSAHPVEEEIELAADQNDAKIDWTITGIAGVLVAAIVVWGVALPDSFGDFSG